MSPTLYGRPTSSNRSVPLYRLTARVITGPGFDVSTLDPPAVQNLPSYNPYYSSETVPPTPATSALPSGVPDMVLPLKHLFVEQPVAPLLRLYYGLPGSLRLQLWSRLS